MNEKIRPDNWGTGGGLGIGDLITAYESFKHPKLTLRELKKRHKSLSETLACMDAGMIVEDRYQKNRDHLVWLIEDCEEKIKDEELKKSKNKKPSQGVRRGRKAAKANENK